MRDGGYPDCHTEGCQFEEEDVPCADCPLIGEEYQQFVEDASCPLYRQASLYLLDKELGLDRFWDEPEYRVIEAIRFVYSERNRQEEEMRKWSARG